MVTKMSLTRRVLPGPAESEPHMANRSDDSLHLSARSLRTHLTQKHHSKDAFVGKAVFEEDIFSKRSGTECEIKL